MPSKINKVHAKLNTRHFIDTRAEGQTKMGWSMRQTCFHCSHTHTHTYTNTATHTHPELHPQLHIDAFTLAASSARSVLAHGCCRSWFHSSWMLCLLQFYRVPRPSTAPHQGRLGRLNSTGIAKLWFSPDDIILQLHVLVPLYADAWRAPTRRMSNRSGCPFRSAWKITNVKQIQQAK